MSILYIPKIAVRIITLVQLTVLAFIAEVPGQVKVPYGEIRIVESWRPDINVLGHNVLQYLYE